MVRVIRTFRPDVLVARFSGTERDGHGHHQASSILAKEAFRAAADPKRFPEQMAEGLRPWQAKKLYIGNVCGFRGADLSRCRLDAEAEHRARRARPWACRMCSSRCRDCGTKCRKERRTGLSTRGIGLRFTGWWIRCCRSIVPKQGHEKSFFDGIDTSWPGLAAQLGAEEKRLPRLREELSEIARQVAEATEDEKGNDVSRAATPLMKIVRDCAG